MIDRVLGTSLDKGVELGVESDSTQCSLTHRDAALRACRASLALQRSARFFAKRPESGIGLPSCKTDFCVRFKGAPVVTERVQSSACDCSSPS